MKFKIQNFDLNLLAIFDALMQERNVSKAARKVFLSQSAMSHALNRLRGLLDDPILVRTEKGMRPTPRALAMEVPIREALTKIQHNLYAPEPFDAFSSQRTFIIYSTEFFECAFLPLLTARLENMAPNIRIIAEILTQFVPESGMTNGDIDFVIGVEDGITVPRSLNIQPWFQDSLTCIVRSQNPVVGDSISLEQFTEIPQIIHSTLGTPFRFSFLDQWLENKKLSRLVAVTIQLEDEGREHERAENGDGAEQLEFHVEVLPDGDQRGERSHREIRRAHIGDTESHGDRNCLVRFRETASETVLPQRHRDTEGQ